MYARFVMCLNVVMLDMSFVTLSCDGCEINNYLYVRRCGWRKLRKPPCILNVSQWVGTPRTTHWKPTQYAILYISVIYTLHWISTIRLPPPCYQCRSLATTWCNGSFPDWLHRGLAESQADIVRDNQAVLCRCTASFWCNGARLDFRFPQWASSFHNASLQQQFQLSPKSWYVTHVYCASCAGLHKLFLKYWPTRK